MTKKTNPSAGNPQDRRTAVMLEKIYTEFKVFGEDMDFVKKKVESINTQVGKNTEDITMMRIDLSKIEGRLTGVENKFTGVEGNIKAIQADIADIKNDFGPRLTRLESGVK